MSHTEQKSDSELQELFELACTFHQDQNYDEAEKIYHYLVEVAPGSPIVYYNYGLLLYETHRFQKACSCYEDAIKFAPDNPDILFNYALCLKKCGDYKGTIAAYKKILENNPDDIDSIYNLACCYKDNGDIEEAICNYERVIDYNPEYISALNNLAYLHHKEGNLEKAAHLYSKIVVLNPDHTSAVHMLSSLKGEKLESAPNEYVAEVFDSYSTHYEQSLVKELGYDVPNILRNRFDTIVSRSDKFKNGLDLGCGTGLAAIAFHDICDHLTGVDLSKKMIHEADKKGLYQKLVNIDIEEFLLRKEKKYSIILAADVFTYIGDLHPIFKALYHTSEEASYFCFSTEKTGSGNYQLKKTGRFAHSLHYIKEIAEHTGWKVLEYFPEKLRKEKNKWIEGNLYFLQKTVNV